MTTKGTVVMKTYRWFCICLLISAIIFAAAVSEPASSSFQPKGKTGAAAAQDNWTPPQFAERQAERDKMVQTIRLYGLEDPAVIAAMSAVPRHEFVPKTMRHRAYDDSPLPIGYGQTISQPYIVAEMTRLLHLNKNSKVLEVGTGSGYQAAVLAQFTPHVFTIEIIEPLANAAEDRLQRLGYTAVEVRRGDGYYGWPEKAPFDAVVVTAAAGEIPPPLVEQLKAGGRMVIPVGSVFGTQSLMLVEKDASGQVRTKSLMAVRFVPLTREDSSKR
jgi:protein-L-isoaspartate(D-aspartate) O-methyltransferase